MPLPGRAFKPQGSYFVIGFGTKAPFENFTDGVLRVGIATLGRGQPYPQCGLVIRAVEGHVFAAAQAAVLSRGTDWPPRGQISGVAQLAYLPRQQAVYNKQIRNRRTLGDLDRAAGTASAGGEQGRSRNSQENVALLAADLGPTWGRGGNTLVMTREPAVILMGALNIVHSRCRHKRQWLVLLTVSLLAACSGIPDARQLADRHGLSLQQVHGGPFLLPVLARPDLPAGGALHVYLEGDGRPWLNRVRAHNPTGRSNVALELMLADPGPALLLGRPCYHQPGTPAPPCEPDLWTEGRYSQPVLEALAEAVGELLGKHRPASLVLVGYSGGGVLALLLAQQQTLPTTVVTVASNLDTEAWTEHHRHLPLTGSLNPAQEIAQGAAFRQVHLAGAHDAVVPPATTARYRERHPEAAYSLHEEFDHRCCWVDAWPGFLGEILGTGE